MRWLPAFTRYAWWDNCADPDPAEGQAFALQWFGLIVELRFGRMFRVRP